MLGGFIRLSLCFLASKSFTSINYVFNYSNSCKQTYMKEKSSNSCCGLKAKFK